MYVAGTKADEWKISFQRAANGWNRCWKLMNEGMGGGVGREMGWHRAKSERGALIRIISRCAACANVENVLPSVKGVVVAAGAACCLQDIRSQTQTHTHTHTHTEMQHANSSECVPNMHVCVCVEVGVCVCASVGWSAVLNMMTSKSQRKRSLNLTLATRTKWQLQHNHQQRHCTYYTNNKYGVPTHTHTPAQKHLQHKHIHIHIQQNIINLWQIFHCVVPRDFVLLKQHLW